MKLNFTTSNQQSKTVLIIGVVVAILVVIGAIYGVYAYVKKDEAGKNKTDDQKILIQKVETPTPKSDKKEDEATISDIKVGSITENSAVVTWKTSKSMTSIVDYGITSGSYVWTTGDGTKTTNHSIQINRLSSNVTYYVRVKSTEEANGETVEISKEGGSFKTLEATPKKIEASPKKTNTNTNQNTEKTDPYVGYTLYTNNLYGYEFKYNPDKWDLNNWSNPVGAITLSKKDANPDLASRTFVRVEAADVKNLDELQEKVNKQHGGNLTVKQVTVDGVPALSFTGSGNRVMVYVLNRGKSYSIDYNSTVDSSYDAKSAVDTFKFTERFAGYQTYQNTTYGYEFKYDPKEWVVKKISEEMVDMEVYAAPGQPTPTVRTPGSVIVEDAGSKTLESIKNDHSIPGYRVTNTMVDNIPVVAVTDTSFYLGSTTTFFFKGNKMYKVYFRNNDSGLATAFWESFKFTK